MSISCCDNKEIQQRNLLKENDVRVVVWCGVSSTKPHATQCNVYRHVFVWVV